MKYCVDEETCKKHGLDLPSVLLMMLVKTDVDIGKLLKELEEREILFKQEGLFGNRLYPTQRWDDVLSNILLDSDSVVEVREDDLDTLAKTLMEIFPKGKKPGTNVYWKSNFKDVKLKLKKFFKLYGNHYTNQQIIDAARSYVQSFNGNYSYMRILKYFIWKDEKKVGADGKMYIEEVSELASFIENAGQEEENRDWTTKLL